MEEGRVYRNSNTYLGTSNTFDEYNSREPTSEKIDICTKNITYNFKGFKEPLEPRDPGTRNLV